MVLKRVKARVQVGSASALAAGQVLLFEVLPFTMIMACKDVPNNSNTLLHACRTRSAALPELPAEATSAVPGVLQAYCLRLMLHSEQLQDTPAVAPA